MSDDCKTAFLSVLDRKLKSSYNFVAANEIALCNLMNPETENHPRIFNENCPSSYRFFKNPGCSFFPCHKNSDIPEFNCLFCFCPLYARKVCPGNPTFIEKDGRTVKRCADCVFPHKPENYDRIMRLLKISKNVTRKKEYHHGGEFFFRAGEDGKDFSVSTNPLGLPEGVKNAIRNSVSELERYPEQNPIGLREKISSVYNELFLRERSRISCQNVILGNGASELISLAVAAVQPKSALIVAPTFSGYERALTAFGCDVGHHFLKEDNDFELDESIFASIEKCGDNAVRAFPDMIFLCTPNNPTGRMINPGLLKKIIGYCEENGIFVFVDECFIAFTERMKESAAVFVRESPYLMVLNAFTKIYAMAGIRLGFLLSSNDALLERMNELRPEWNISSLAQIAGSAALEEKEYIEETRRVIKKERDYLSKELDSLGFKVCPSDANFILFSAECERTAGLLQGEEFFLRKCGDFIGLSRNFFRVAVGKHEENQRLVRKLRLKAGHEV